MAFLLSGSINQVISVSIGGVLQPVFSHMHGNRNRQAAAFLKATSVTVAVGMPLCLIQAAVAEAAFALFLPEKWMPVVPMLQVLLIGQCFYISVSPAMGLLKAQGRFAAFLWWQFAQFVFTVLVMLTYGSMVTSDGALGIVTVLALSNVIFAPIGLLLCMRDTGVGAVRILATSFFPFALATISVGSVYGLIQAAGFSRFGQAIGWSADLVLIPLLAGGCYLLVLRLFAPTLLQDCAVLGKPIMRGVRRFIPIN
jgi:O-antigen/teichoic acid export membrane protein